MQVPLSVVDSCGALIGSVLHPKGFIPTTCISIDSVVGGGFGRGEVTEVFGAPGSGRSSICMAACASAILAGSSAIYVDGDGALHFHGARELIRARLAQFPNRLDINAFVDEALDRWLLIRVCSFDELAGGLAHILPNTLRDRGDVSIVVVDSLSQPFRTFDRHGAQKRLESFASRMADIAIRFNVAVIFVNGARTPDSYMHNVTTFEGIVTKDVGISSMGEAWAHACPCRIGIGINHEGERVAHVVKSSRMPRRTARFRLSEKGLENTTG